ncbi:MAG: diaminopimelate epimerase [Thermomonas sp.]
MGADMPRHPLRFTKMHGAGNDFVVLDLRDGRAAPDADLCRALADRHMGVGCDQILTIEAPRSTDAVASYRIRNADGSHAQQCGNGARCIAAWLVRDGAAPAQGDFAIDSPTGLHAVTRDANGRFEIDMGAPEFAPPNIPLAGFVQEQDEYALELDRETLRFGAVSMGNPHAVIEVDAVDLAPVGHVGPWLQRSRAFPESVNVGFAQVLAPDRIRLRVYERGAGETLACGSGACAAVAVLARRGRVDAANGVAVSLPGGELRIHYDPAGGGIAMSGPATFVFEGNMFEKDWER